MPLYDYRCEQCGNIEERFFSIKKLKKTIKCPKCGGRAGRFWGKPPANHIFKPFWHEHLDDHPVYIETKQQLRDECRKRGLAMPQHGIYGEAY